jgi:hypothetical protein
VIKILLDNDIAGFQTLLIGTLESAGWSEYKLIEVITLKDIGLDREAKDREIWRRCQLDSLILLTANRNHDDADSLEQTISEENTLHSLPIITISDQQRLHNSAYREACIESLLTIVLELNNHLGAGRLYVP